MCHVSSRRKRNEPRQPICWRGSCSSASCEEDADEEEDEEAREPAGLAAKEVQQHQPGEDGEAHSRSPWSGMLRRLERAHRSGGRAEGVRLSVTSPGR
jgi:hypothetical protein